MNDQFELRIAQYLQVRAKKEELKKEYETRLKPINDALDALGSYLQSMLNQTGQESARAKAGTAYITTKRSATIADGAAFRRYVIGSEAWDLVDWRANEVKVAELVEEIGEPPPGVNFSTTRKVGVRRPTNGE